jgi:hypothetical protein
MLLTGFPANVEPYFGIEGALFNCDAKFPTRGFGPAYCLDGHQGSIVIFVIVQSNCSFYACDLSRGSNGIAFMAQGESGTVDTCGKFLHLVPVNNHHSFIHFSVTDSGGKALAHEHRATLKFECESL